MLTVAHNFLTVKGSEVVTKSGRTNTVYKATLPNGLSVNFQMMILFIGIRKTLYLALK